MVIWTPAAKYRLIITLSYTGHTNLLSENSNACEKCLTPEKKYFWKFPRRLLQRGSLKEPLASSGSGDKRMNHKIYVLVASPSRPQITYLNSDDTVSWCRLCQNLAGFLIPLALLLLVGHLSHGWSESPASSQAFTFKSRREPHLTHFKSHHLNLLRG